MTKLTTRLTLASGLALSVATLLACSGSAQQTGPLVETVEPPTEAPAFEPEPLTDRQTDNIVRNSERILERAKRLLFELDNEGVLTAQRASDYMDHQAAMGRGLFLAEFYASDLDGDLTVTREEVSIVASFGNPSRRSGLYEQFEQIDTDQDARASYSEMLAFKREQDKEQNRGRGPSQLSAMQLFNFDENKDGAITEAEIAAGLARIAEDPQNIAYANNPRLREREQLEATQCLLPEAGADDQIILVSGYEGSAISPITVRGQDDETTVLRLDIERGRKPLYIVALSYDDAIWEITGATGRISHFVAQRQRNTKAPFAGVGVIGLPEDNVSFVDDCGKYFTSSEDGVGSVVAGKIAARLGRPVDTVLGSYVIGGFKIPSGEQSLQGPEPVRTHYLDMGAGDDLYLDSDGNALAWSKWIETNQPLPPRPPRVDEDTWRRLHRSKRDGIAQIALSDVVAPAPVTPYEILPNEAGLAQLLEDRSLERTPDGYYRLLKDIPNFPAGLGGAHKVDFLIAPGVARPSGGGHSTIFIEETGKCATRDCYR